MAHNTFNAPRSGTYNSVSSIYSACVRQPIPGARTTQLLSNLIDHKGYSNNGTLLETLTLSTISEEILTTPR